MSNWTIMENTDILKQDVEKWIKTILEMEKDINPGYDETGELSKNNKIVADSAGYKWYLMGSFGNEKQVFRDMAKYATIDATSPVLIIAVSTDASNSEPRYAESTEAELRSSAKEIFDIHETVEIIINGTRIDRNNGLKAVETDLMEVHFPANNAYADITYAREGVFPLVCYAWAVELQFEPGNYDIELQSYHPPIPKLGLNFFNQDVRYQIKVA